MDPGIIATIAGGAVVLVVAVFGLRVVREHERAVVLRLGRRGPVLAPGLHYVLPFGIDRLTRVDLRSRPLPVDAHEVITHDGVPVRVSTVAHLQVLNPLLAVTRVVDYRAAAGQLVHAALREVVAARGLREVLLDQADLRDALSRFVEARMEPWGVAVTAIDVDEVLLPEAMQRAMARYAELRGEQQPFAELPGRPVAAETQPAAGDDELTPTPDT